MAPAALRGPGRIFQPELLASPPPPLEWDNLGVICGRAAKALNLLLGTWISFPRRGTGGERGKGRGAAGPRGCGEALGRIWAGSVQLQPGGQRRLSCKAPPKGVSKQGQVTPGKGKCFHWCENPGEQKDSQTRNKANKSSEILSILPLPASDSALNPSFSLTYCAKPWLTCEPHVRINHQQPPWGPTALGCLCAACITALPVGE